MYLNIIKNDIIKSKMITLTTMCFVAIAATLVSLAAILLVNLPGAINALMTRAKTPHFMQMHSGGIDKARLAAFADGNASVDSFQILEFLNITGARIVFGNKSLADSVQDNGFCVQSDKFDYLLDFDGRVIEVNDGELYAPICYMKDETTRVGDRATISGKEFIVAGFLRDSQMNSMLSSSKRFLVSENDYASIESSGSIEYLIEFRLKTLSDLSTFEADYTSAGLESNGPTITYPLFKTLSAVSDGMMLAVILLMSILVVAIAFMCIRFTLLAKIEDDYREIGVMKAIGLRISDIRKVYLAKYAAIAGIGCVIGYALSHVFKDDLLGNIRLYLGESDSSMLAHFLGILAVSLVFLAIVAYVSGVLRRLRKISPAEAIRFGISQDKFANTSRLTLSRNRLINTNIFLGIKDVLSRVGLYTTMFGVLVISAFIIAVPQNLHNTISQKSFITYMGVGNCDIRFDVQQVDHITSRAAEIEAVLSKDSAIDKYAVFTTKALKSIGEDGSEAMIMVELGNHSIFPIKYVKGRAPTTKSDISLSVMNADELAKKVGSTISMVVDGKEVDLTVCGIYSDVTNGGKTAKAVFRDTSSEVMRCIICTELLEKTLVEEKTSEYERLFEFAKVSDIDKFIAQTYGSTIASVGKASYLSIAAALIITALVTLLFIKMLIAKNRYSIAVMKAYGFMSSDIVVQYVSSSVFVLVGGVVLGTFLANTLGEVIAGIVISSFGASSFVFSVNPLFAYVLNPLMMVLTVFIAAIIGTLGVRQIEIFENIKE